MNEINPAQSLLNTLQVLRAQAQNLEISAPPATGTTTPGAFAGILGQITAQQSHAAELAASVERGEEGASLVDAMIASNRARISFEALKQVRNKALSAYQDVMNMPV